MYHDSCTAGPLSDWLNGWIGACCDAHDLALDHSYDVWTFIRANIDLAGCAAQVSSVLAVIVFVAVSGPIGWLLYRLGPKRGGNQE